MAATALPPFDVAALSRFLTGASGAEKVEVTACELLAGGAIQENWGLDVFFSDGRLAGPQRLVLRTNAASGIPSSLARLDEFAVLQAASAAGWPGAVRSCRAYGQLPAGWCGVDRHPRLGIRRLGRPR